MDRKKAFASFFPDDRVHLHNVGIRGLLKELTKAFVITANAAAFINFEFRLFVSFPELDLSWKINVPDIKQTGINVVIDGLFTAHQIILMVDIDLVD